MPKKLFVASLASNVRKHEIIALFSKFGKVKRVELVSQKNSSRCKGFAFVTFLDEKDALKVLETEVYMKGRKLTIREQLKGKKLSQFKNQFRQRRMFVGDLPKNTSDDDLFQTFGKIGQVETAYIIRNHETGQNTSFGYVLFRKLESIAKALNSSIKIHGKVIRCERFKQKKEELVGHVGQEGCMMNNISSSSAKDPRQLKKKNLQNMSVKGSSSRRISLKKNSSIINYPKINNHFQSPTENFQRDSHVPGHIHPMVPQNRIAFSASSSKINEKAHQKKLNRINRLQKIKNLEKKYKEENAEFKAQNQKKKLSLFRGLTQQKRELSSHSKEFIPSFQSNSMSQSSDNSYSNLSGIQEFNFQRPILDPRIRKLKKEGQAQKRTRRGSLNSSNTQGMLKPNLCFGSDGIPKSRIVVSECQIYMKNGMISHLQNHQDFNVRFYRNSFTGTRRESLRSEESRVPIHGSEAEFTKFYYPEINSHDNEYANRPSYIQNQQPTQNDHEYLYGNGPESQNLRLLNNEEELTKYNKVNYEEKSSLPFSLRIGKMMSRLTNQNKDNGELSNFSQAQGQRKMFKLF